MNLNSEQTTKILHAVTADKLQGKKKFTFPICPFSCLCTGLAQAMNYLGQVHTMGRSNFCSISWLVPILFN